MEMVRMGQTTAERIKKLRDELDRPPPAELSFETQGSSMKPGKLGQ